MSVPNRRFGDRRSKPRFEVVGALWGSLETVEPLRLLNISHGGAFVESSVALAVDSVHRIRLSWGDQVVDQQVRVLHQRPAPTAGGERFLVGFEFLSERSPFEGQLDQLASAGS